MEAWKLETLEALARHTKGRPRKAFEDGPHAIQTTYDPDIQILINANQTYFSTLPALRHFAQTLIFFTVPSLLVLISIRLGSHVLLVLFLA